MPITSDLSAKLTASTSLGNTEQSKWSNSSSAKNALALAIDVNPPRQASPIMPSTSEKIYQLKYEATTTPIETHDRALKEIFWSVSDKEVLKLGNSPLEREKILTALPKEQREILEAKLEISLRANKARYMPSANDNKLDNAAQMVTQMVVEKNDQIDKIQNLAKARSDEHNELYKVGSPLARGQKRTLLGLALTLGASLATFITAITKGSIDFEADELDTEAANDRATDVASKGDYQAEMDAAEAQAKQTFVDQERAEYHDANTTAERKAQIESHYLLRTSNNGSSEPDFNVNSLLSSTDGAVKNSIDTARESAKQTAYDRVYKTTYDTTLAAEKENIESSAKKWLSIGIPISGLVFGAAGTLALYANHKRGQADSFNQLTSQPLPSNRMNTMGKSYLSDDLPDIPMTGRNNV